MGGEKQGGREHIDRTTKYLIDRAGMPPKEAERKARETRIRVEDRENGGRR